MKTLRLVSVSGGKDSTATLLLALETNWLDDVRAVFADTGNEHEITLEYVDYLEQETGIKIERVKADFTKQMAAKREKLLRIAAGVPESEIYGKRVFKHQWTPERAARAAELMQPTGSPYLDVCLLKGMFPRRNKQFCTEELKSLPIQMHNAALISAGYKIEEWHGIRADESPRRAAYADYEFGPIVSVRRPILRWGVERVFEQHRRHGIKPNPLYAQGMGRVGCMPCINAGKDEMAEIARRFPEHVERIREWERLVGDSSRTHDMGFFHQATTHEGGSIDAVVRWATTSHGGRQQDFIRAAEPEMCSSLYGLCE